jgi:hypothetical protein
MIVSEEYAPYRVLAGCLEKNKSDFSYSVQPDRRLWNNPPESAGILLVDKILNRIVAILSK